MTTTPTSSETTIVRDSITRPVVGRSISNASSRALSSIAIRKPPPIPITAPSRPIARASTTTVGEDLAPRGAERAQHAELGHPLGDRDREGVEDQEGADEDRDEGEDEQEDLQEAEVFADFFGAAVGVFLSRSRPGRRRGISRAIRCFSSRRRDALVGGDRDLVEAPDLVGEPLRHRQRHLGDAGAAEGGAAEAGEADQLEGAGAALADQPDLFAELQAGAFGRRLVDRGFGRAARPVAFDVGERLEPAGQARGDELGGEFVADLVGLRRRRSRPG